MPTPPKRVSIPVSPTYPLPCCVVPCNDEFSAKVDLSRAIEFFDFASKSFFWSLTLWSLPWMCGMSTCAVYVVLGIFV